LLYLIHVSITVGGFDQCARSGAASITPRPPHPGDSNVNVDEAVIVPPITAPAIGARKMGR